MVRYADFGGATFAAEQLAEESSRETLSSIWPGAAFWRPHLRLIEASA